MYPSMLLRVYDDKIKSAKEKSQIASREARRLQFTMNTDTHREAVKRGQNLRGACDERGWKKQWEFDRGDPAFGTEMEQMESARREQSH